MKLSLDKRLGHLQVRGGRIVRVIMPHAVPTSTWNEAAATSGTHLGTGKPAPPRFAGGETHVTAKPGDLAVEIVIVKTGKLQGHTYLSGAAIQLNSYGAKPEWFAEGRGERRTLERPTDPERDHKRAVLWAMDMKYGLADLYAFEYFAADGQEAQEAGFFLRDLFGIAPVGAGAFADMRTAGMAELADRLEGKELSRHAHVFAILHRGPKKKDGVIALHFQPVAQDHMAMPFQIGLVLSSL